MSDEPTPDEEVLPGEWSAYGGLICKGGSIVADAITPDWAKEIVARLAEHDAAIAKAGEPSTEENS